MIEDMHLKILIPSRLFLSDYKIVRIVAESPRGSFGILPQRLDCVSALVPGLFMYQKRDCPECYVAVDEGVLVKSGGEVLVSVRNAIGGTTLQEIKDTVERKVLALTEHEHEMRRSLARLESGLISSFRGVADV